MLIPMATTCLPAQVPGRWEIDACGEEMEAVFCKSINQLVEGPYLRQGKLCLVHEEEGPSPRITQNFRFAR